MSDEQKTKRKMVPWWLWVVGIDFFLLLVTALRKHPIDYPGKHLLSRHFNLAVEQNTAVWWSGICLLALSLLAYELFSKGGRGKFAWLSLSVVFACLSFDEIAAIHERVGSLANLLPYGVVFASISAYALTALLRDPQTRRSALFIGAGFCVFGSVVLQEYLEHTVQWPSWALGLRVAMEEGSELLAMLLIFFGIVAQRSGSMPRSFRAIIPNPANMKNLPQIVLAGWLLHSLASVTAPLFMDLSVSGNPLGWYPLVVFFLLFAEAQRFGRTLAPKPKALPILSGFFVLCSAGLIYIPPRLLPGIGTLVPNDYQPGVFFMSVVTLLLLIGAAIPGFWSRNRRYGPLILALPLLSLFERRMESQFLVAGILAFVVFIIFQRYCRFAEEMRTVREFPLATEQSSTAAHPAMVRETVRTAAD